MRESSEKPALKSSRILNTYELASALGNLVGRVEHAAQLLRSHPLPASDKIAQLIDTAEARSALGWEPAAALPAGTADEPTEKMGS